MKKILFIFLLTNSIFAQKFYVKSNTDLFIDYNTKTANLIFKDYTITGTFSELNHKKNNYLIINEGKKNWVIKILNQSEIYGIDVLEGQKELIYKEVKKGRKYKKSKLVFTNLPSDKGLNELNMIDESTKTFITKLSKSDLIGVYDIEIRRSSNVSFVGLDVYGKLYILENGITFQSDLVTLDLIRGSYNYSGNPGDPENGSFCCKINKGIGDFFCLVIDKKNSDRSVQTGAITVNSGGINTTTTFRVVQK